MELQKGPELFRAVTSGTKRRVGTDRNIDSSRPFAPSSAPLKKGGKRERATPCVERDDDVIVHPAAQKYGAQRAQLEAHFAKQRRRQGGGR